MKGVTASKVSTALNCFAQTDNMCSKAKSKIKVFHYAQIDDWLNIRNGSWKSGDEPGLGASRRMGKVDTEAWETAAVFALLEPTPDNWVHNQDFDNMWIYLKRNVGSLLLEIEIDADKDDVFVVDWGHREGILRENQKGIPKRYLHTSAKEAERAYMESKIPISEYVLRQNELNYSLPEVVILHNVPFEKIRVSKSQSSLEKKLEMYRGEFRDYLIRRIKSIPELSEWFNEYQKREGIKFEVAKQQGNELSPPL